jgi:hypothetical protein
MVLKGVLSLGFLCVVSRLIDCVEHKTRLCASCAHANFLPTFQKLRWRSESGIFLFEARVGRCSPIMAGVRYNHATGVKELKLSPTVGFPG